MNGKSKASRSLGGTYEKARNGSVIPLESRPQNPTSQIQIAALATPFITSLMCQMRSEYSRTERFASLVWDQSKLNNTRTCIAWLSPNLWVNGSFYGNIKFAFDWRELIEGKRFYRVEDIKYAPPAYRILITKNQPVLDWNHTTSRVRHRDLRRKNIQKRSDK